MNRRFFIPLCLFFLVTTIFVGCKESTAKTDTAQVVIEEQDPLRNGLYTERFKVIN